MRRAAFALLAAGVALGEPSRVVLVQELVRVEAMERKPVALFPLEQQDASLDVRFKSERGGEGVRIAVYSANSHTPLAESRYELSGAFRTQLPRNGQYRVEIENLRQRLGHALVDVEVAVVFGTRAETSSLASPRTLDPRRRLYTILGSLSLFAVIVAYSAIRLTPPIRQRLRGER